MTPGDLGRAALMGYCGLLIAVGLGRFGFPPLIPAMVEGGWATPTALHAAGSANLAGYVAGALLTVAVLRRLGTRSTVVSASVLATLAFAVSIVPLPSFAFMVARFLSGFTGAFLMVAVPALVADMVPINQRGRAGGIAFAGIGSGFLLSGTVLPVLAGAGPGPAWLAMTLVLAVATAIVTALLPKHNVQITTALPGRGFPRSRAYWGLAALYGAGAAGYVPHTLVLVDYVARDLGHGLGIGGLVWIAAGATAAIAPILAGWAADRFGFAPALRVVVAVMAIGALMPALTAHPALLILSGALGGGLMIGLGSLTSGRTREIVGGEAYVRAWAELTVMFSLTQAFSAFAVTAALATFGTYPPVFVVASIILATGLAAERFTRPQGGN